MPTHQSILSFLSELALSAAARQEFKEGPRKYINESSLHEKDKNILLEKNGNALLSALETDILGKDPIEPMVW